MRKKFAGIVFVVMVILFIASPILAEDVLMVDEFFIGLRPSNIDRSHLQKNPPRLQSNQSPKNVGASALPSYYDLRDYNGVT